MAEKSRLETVEEWVKAKPGDAFTRYALALEYRGAGRTKDALREFATLVEKNPDYVATYLIYGQLLVQDGQVDQARKILERGRAVADKAGNQHAVSEISELLGSLS